MRCEELMKRDAVTVSPKDTVQLAARYMRDEDIGFIPICDENKKVIGTITDRDITIRLVADGKSLDSPVQDFMSKEVISCRSQDDLQDAEKLMMQHQKSRIVCTDEQGRLEGIISLSDIAQAESGDRAAEVMRDVAEREAPSVH